MCEKRRVKEAYSWDQIALGVVAGLVVQILFWEKTDFFWIEPRKRALYLWKETCKRGLPLGSDSVRGSSWTCGAGRDRQRALYLRNENCFEKRRVYEAYSYSSTYWHIYIYMYMCMYMYICMYVYVDIHMYVYVYMFRKETCMQGL